MPHRSPLVTVAERQACLGGRTVPYVVKRSPQARRVRFEIKPRTGLTVILPRRCSLDTVDGLVQSKARWILAGIDRYIEPALGPRNRELEFGDSVPFLGQELRIVQGCDAGPSKGAELHGNELVVHGDGMVARLGPALRRWYGDQAAMILERKARESAAVLGVQYSRVSIRGQRTRWGSCSHKGTLSFNWRLIMAPEPVVDYVVIHETAHLLEMNHTGRFWKLVSERCPSWRDHKKWLDDHGAELTVVLGPPQ